MRRARAIACVAVIGCVLLIASCGLSGMAVQQHLVAGPDVRLQLGPYQLVASTTKRPVCRPNQDPLPAGLPCTADSLVGSEEVYVVWLLRSAQPGGRLETAEQLLALPLR